LPEAVLVNPYSERNMDAGLDRALDMAEPERQEQLAKMRERVLRWDVDHWAGHVRERFEALSAPADNETRDAA
jgi:glucosylglycerol-phosphate synthase